MKKRYVKKVEYKYELSGWSALAGIISVIGFTIAIIPFFAEIGNILAVLTPIAKVWCMVGLGLMSLSFIALFDFKRKVWWEEQ